MNRILLLLFFIIGLTLLSCGVTDVKPATQKEDSVMVKIDTSFVVYYDVNTLGMSNAFDSGRTSGLVSDLALNEISGMAFSYTTPDALWVEEDSGNENKIYLISTSGKELAALRMGVDNRDWEDMSIARGPVAGKNYIYLADIGDNKKINPVKYIYRFIEPSITNSNEIINGIEKILFKYPDGIKNAEAMMIDPLTKDIYIISKEDAAVVYVAPYPQDLTHTITLIKLGVLPIPTVTAADISPDGSEIIVKNYDKVFYWKRKDGETLSHRLQQKPTRLAYIPESQGESICWTANAAGYYTTTEIVGEEAVAIYYYRRR